MDTLIAILVRLLETMFMLGIVGSAAVLVLSSIEDVKSLLPGSYKKEGEADAPSRPRTAPPSQLHTGDSTA